MYNQGVCEVAFDRGNEEAGKRGESVDKTFVGGIVWGTCVIDGEDNIYVGSSSGKFFKIDKAGRIVWVYNLVSKTDSLVDSAAVLHPLGFVVVPGGDGYLHALDMKTGEVVWRLKAPHNVDDKVDRSGVVVNSFEGNVQVNPWNGVLYAGCDNGNFYAVRPDGRELWSVKTGMMIWSCAAFLGDNGELVVFGCLDHHVYLVDAANGTVYDKFDTRAEIKSSPLVVRVAGGVGQYLVYMCNSNGKVMCFHASKEGGLRMLWEHDYGTEIYSSPAYKDGILVVCTFDGRIMGIACEENTQRVIWQHKTYNQICCSPIITKDDLVIVGDSSGKVYVIKLKSGIIEACAKVSSHYHRTHLNASPAIDSRGIIHIGSYDGHIHHVSYKKCLEIKEDPVPRFIRVGHTHLELEYDGIFIKTYRSRVFGERYIENAAININSVVLDGKGGQQVVVSSDGKYVNFVHSKRMPIDIAFSCRFYDQTNNWFKDRVQGSMLGAKVVQRIQHDFVNMGNIGMLNHGQVISWDVTELAVFQPKILDTYIPAALDSVTFKVFMFATPIVDDSTSGSDIAVGDVCIKAGSRCFNDSDGSGRDIQKVTCIMIPAVKNHERNDSLVVIPEPQKVILLDGDFDGSTVIARSRGPFEISSMGGTMKFSNFGIYMSIDEETLDMKTEFLLSSSCLSIKGNDDNYKFSSEIVNQLCDPFMNIYAVGTGKGVHIPVRFNGKACSLGVKKELFGMRTNTYVNLYSALGIGGDGENLATIVYNTQGDDLLVVKPIVVSLKADVSIKVPNDIKNIWLFVNDIYCGSLLL